MIMDKIRKIFKGEPLTVSGRLTRNGEATTSPALSMRIYRNNTLIRTLPLAAGADGTYSGAIDTNEITGHVYVRIVASVGDDEIVVANNDIELIINE